MFNETRKILIVITVLSIIVGAYYLGTTSKKQIIPKITQNVDLGSNCDTDSKNYFNNMWEKRVKDSETYKTINLSYQNNYDKTNNSCYVLVNYNFKTIYSFGLSYLSINYRIVDIYKKDQYGYPMTFGVFHQNVSYSDGRKDQLLNCNAFGNECDTVDRFISYVKPYLGQ